MKTANAYRALERTARRNGVTFETVWKEIECAIAEGMANSESSIQNFWRRVPCKREVPTPVELVTYLSEQTVLGKLPAHRSSRK